MKGITQPDDVLPEVVAEDKKYIIECCINTMKLMVLELAENSGADQEVLDKLNAFLDEPSSNEPVMAPRPGAVKQPGDRGPRFDLASLRPYEAIFVDNYTYDDKVYGKCPACIILVDVKTGAVHHWDVRSKTDNGKAVRDILVSEGAHKLPYKCTVYADNCGSMKHVKTAATMQLGMDFQPLPPWEPNINQAENAINSFVPKAKALLNQAQLAYHYMPFALQYSMYVHYRMASLINHGLKSPYEQIRRVVPNLSHLTKFGQKVFVNIPREQRKVFKNKAQRKKESDGVYDAAKTSEKGIMIGFHSLVSHTYKVLFESKEIRHSRSVQIDKLSSPPMPSRGQPLPANGKPSLPANGKPSRPGQAVAPSMPQAEEASVIVPACANSGQQVLEPPHNINIDVGSENGSQPLGPPIATGAPQDPPLPQGAHHCHRSVWWRLRTCNKPSMKLLRTLKTTRSMSNLRRRSAYPIRNR